MTVVEEIEATRAPQTSFEAAYILQPTRANVDSIIRDFSKAQKQYAAAHLFLVDGMDDRTVQKLTASVDQHLQSFVELFVNFFPLEAQVFSTMTPQSFFSLYSPEQRDGLEMEIEKLAGHLVSVCATLGEYPLIRYHRHLDEDHGAKSLPYKLAMTVQSELDTYCRNNPDFPPQSEAGRPRGVLIITDRTLDMFAPILHEFTYQAMVHDLLPIEDGKKYVYEGEGVNGPEQKEAILDDKDKIWTEYRHVHMSEAITKLIADFNKFIGEHTNFSDGEKATSLDDMADMLASLPQYKEMKEKYSLHINLAQKCMNLFEQKKLPLTAAVEQSCATGSTPEGKVPKTLVEDMVPLLDDRAVSNFDKIRLLMSYILYRDGLLDDDRRKLFSHARISPSEGEAFNNLQVMGIRLVKAPGERERKVKKPKKKNDEDQFDLSRYVPVLKTVIEDHIKGTLDSSLYPYTKDAPEGDETSKGGAPASSLRSARPMWHKSRSSVNEVRQRIIVFVAGGMTYSEIRSAYEVSKALQKDVIIGSTHTTTPKAFINDLKHLRRGASRRTETREPERAPAALRPGGGLGLSARSTPTHSPAPSSSSSRTAPIGGGLPPRRGASPYNDRNGDRGDRYEDVYARSRERERERENGGRGAVRDHPRDVQRDDDRYARSTDYTTSRLSAPLSPPSEDKKKKKGLFKF